MAYVQMNKNQHVTTLTLNKPKANALSTALLKELWNTFSLLETDDETRVIVLRGEGKFFCAGADIAHMRSMMSATAMTGWPADADQRRANGPSGAVSGLSFGGGHGAFAARGTGHRFHSEVLRYGTLRRWPLRQPSVAGRLRRGSLWPRRSAPFCLRGQRPRVCAACG